MNVRCLSFVSVSFLQAALMHIFLHLCTHFMFDFGILQQGMRSCDPLLDNSIRKVASIVALLARRFLDFFLVIDIIIGCDSLGILICKAGPVIANGFR